MAGEQQGEQQVVTVEFTSLRGDLRIVVCLMAWTLGLLGVGEGFGGCLLDMALAWLLVRARDISGKKQEKFGSDIS